MECLQNKRFWFEPLLASRWPTWQAVSFTKVVSGIWFTLKNLIYQNISKIKYYILNIYLIQLQYNINDTLFK